MLLIPENYISFSRLTNVTPIIGILNIALDFPNATMFNYVLSL